MFVGMRARTRVKGGLIRRFLAKSPFVLLAGSLVVVGCNDKALESTDSSDAGKHLGGSITPEQAGKVLAKVGDHTITLGDFVAAIEHMDQFDRLRYQSPVRRAELLTEMINIQLLADEAVAKGYDKDPHVQQEIRAVLRDAMLAESHKGAPTGSDLTEAEVRAYYDKNRDSFRDPERRRVSLIVLADVAKANDALDAAKKAPNASAWGEVVKARSIDPAAKALVPVDLVGDFGIVSAPGSAQTEPTSKVPAAVRTALFHIANIGDVYDGVVEGEEHKFYVVRLTQKTEAHDRSYAEAERSIRVRLVQEKIREKEEALVAQLKGEFPVQIDDAVLATVRVADAGPPASDAAAAPPPPSATASAAASAAASAHVAPPPHP